MSVKVWLPCLFGSGIFLKAWFDLCMTFDMFYWNHEPCILQITNKQTEEFETGKLLFEVVAHLLCHSVKCRAFYTSFCNVPFLPWPWLIRTRGKNWNGCTKAEGKHGLWRQSHISARQKLPPQLRKTPLHSYTGKTKSRWIYLRL